MSDDDRTLSRTLSYKEKAILHTAKAMYYPAKAIYNAGKAVVYDLTGWFEGDYLLFNGKKLIWKTERRQNSYITKYEWSYAKSGLGSDNPAILTLIESGREDIEIDQDYTDAKYQNLSRAGPIPEGTYELPLTPTMAYVVTGGGWGIGGWPIFPAPRAGKISNTIEVRSKFDIPRVRSGFFLHEDHNEDGTAGCIGLSNIGIKNLKGYLSDYHNLTGNKEIHIVVDYNSVEK